MIRTSAICAVVLLVSPGVAQAYIGPGLGIGAIGAALGTIGAILLGIFAIVYYPMKRAIRRRSAAKAQPDEHADG